MKLLKKSMSFGMALLLTLSLAACGGQPETPSSETKDPTVETNQGETTPDSTETPATVRVAALKGPTGMGLAYLEETSANENNVSPYELTLAAAADEITPSLIQGELDMACVPANLAAVLYQKTKGEIVNLGINTLGVLYIVELGDSVQSMEDLKGQTIVAAGKGSTPEYALRYLLAQNGIDPEQDVTIDWKSEHSECVSALASGAATIALLPQPFVTVAGNKLTDLRIALDLTQEWDALENDSALLTGVVVARKAFVEEYPAVVERFLTDYATSVEQVNDNPAEAAVVIGEMGIVDAAVAEKAIPYCNIVCITGEEMKDKLSGYLEVLLEANPQSVGGQLPGDDFYFGA